MRRGQTETARRFVHLEVFIFSVHNDCWRATTVALTAITSSHDSWCPSLPFVNAFRCPRQKYSLNRLRLFELRENGLTNRPSLVFPPRNCTYTYEVKIALESPSIRCTRRHPVTNRYQVNCQIEISPAGMSTSMVRLNPRHHGMN